MSADGALATATRAESLPAAAERRHRPVNWSAVVDHLLLLACAAVIAFPLYYAFVISTQTVDQVMARPPVLRPSDHMLDNYVAAWTRGKMGTLLWNSAVVTQAARLGMMPVS